MLQAHVGEADEIKVVVPVVRQGALDWLANDDKAFGHAERVAGRTANQLFLARRSRRLPGKQTSVWRFAMLWQRFPPMRSSLRCAPVTRKGWSSRSRLTVLRNEL